jgi:hypothetical protein
MAAEHMLETGERTGVYNVGNTDRVTVRARV